MISPRISLVDIPRSAGSWGWDQIDAAQTGFPGRVVRHVVRFRNIRPVSVEVSCPNFQHTYILKLCLLLWNFDHISFHQYNTMSIYLISMKLSWNPIEIGLIRVLAKRREELRGRGSPESVQEERSVRRCGAETEYSHRFAVGLSRVGHSAMQPFRLAAAASSWTSTWIIGGLDWDDRPVSALYAWKAQSKGERDSIVAVVLRFAKRGGYN